MSSPRYRPLPFVGRAAALDDLRSALQRPDIDCVTLVGPPGSGTTRVVSEWVTELANPPWWWRCSIRTQTLPLGALWGAVDPPTNAARSTSMATPISAVIARATARLHEAGGVIVLDDATLIDSVSADLLRLLTTTSKVKLIVTAADHDAIPSELDWLWHHPRTRHHDLPPLADADVAQLVATALPGLDLPTRSRIIERLQARSGGNALLLKELIGALVESRDDELLVGATTPLDLHSVVDTRLQGMSRGVRSILEHLGMQCPVAIDFLAERCGPEAIDEAKAAGLIQRVEESGWELAAPTHPFYAERAVLALSPAERKSTTRQLAEASLSTEHIAPSQHLAAVVTLLDSGSELPRSQRIDASRFALAALDYPLAANLARSVLAEEGSSCAATVLGSVQSALGDRTTAVQTLENARSLACTDIERARASGAMAAHLLAYGSPPEPVVHLLSETLLGLSDPEAIGFVNADLATLSAVRGEQIRPMGVLGGDEVRQLDEVITHAYALAVGGDSTGYAAAVAAGLPLADRCAAMVPWANDLLQCGQVFIALAELGPAAAAESTRSARAMVDPSIPGTDGLWRFLLGLTHAVGSQLDAADRQLLNAKAALHGHDVAGVLPLAGATHAWVLAQSGRIGESRALIEMADVSREDDCRVDLLTSLAEAWCDAAERIGKPSDRVVAAAAVSIEHGQLVPALLALNDAVRLGGAAEARSAIRTIEDLAPPSWLAGFVSERAAAMVSADTDRLRDLAVSVEQIWPIAAAELNLEVRRRCTSLQDAVKANRAAVAARMATETLGNSLPETVRNIRSPLSDREQLVARLARTGAMNREVAELAGVSVRTVENQLQSIYRKLGIRSRKELAELFG